MSEMGYRRQLQNFTHSDEDLVVFVRAVLESPLPIPEQLHLVLHLDDLDMLRHAVCMAGRLEISELAPVLIGLYETMHDETLQWRTVEALGYMEDEQAHQFLLTLLQSREKTSLRIAAAYAFHGRKRPGTVVPLLTIAQRTTEYAELRGMAIEALAYQGDKSLLPQILPFLQDPEAVVRWDAVYTVGSLGDKSFTSFVEPLVSDCTWATRMQTVADEAREVLERWDVLPSSENE